MNPKYILALGLFLAVHTSSQAQRCYRKPHPQTKSCEPSARYRTMSGQCNNLANPEWGSTGEKLRRFVPNAYKDGRDIPRGGRHPSSLPSPRWVSQKNHPDSDVPDSRFTHMVMQFGQFLDHDITLAPKDEGTDCCKSGVQGPECFTIPIPSPDRFFSWVNNSATCLNVIRSTPICDSQIREQYNELTSFIDASNIYGSDEGHGKLLRTFKDGRLQRNKNTDQLPTRQQLGVAPNTQLLRPEKQGDFMAGDMRVNEHPFLATLHVVFLREHNRMAKLLKEYLPSEFQTDEIVYQETRRLIGAQMQNIVYGEFLPTVLGVDFMTRYDLIVKEETEYDINVDATIFNSFSAAAFRFGHSMINGMFKLVSQRQPSTRSKDVYWLWRLREVFDGQSIRGARLPLENMLEGLITQEPQTSDAFFTTEITDHLFQKNDLRENFGHDLLALNIQRGRDHGIPGYNGYRKQCGLRPIKNWSEKPSELDQDYWEKLREVYTSVNDIDLFVAAIAEKNAQGGVVGPTFACLIGEQFSRLKRGDRYFYTHTKQSGGQGLGPVARKAILQRTMGDIMCDVSQLEQSQKWVTLQPNSDYNQLEPCSVKFKMDMRAVAQEISQELNSGRRGVRQLVKATPTNGNQFLIRGHPIQFKAEDVVTRPLPQESGSLPKPQELRSKHSRIPDNFSFPSTHSSSQSGLPGQVVQPSRRGQILTNRLSNNARIGISSTACIFQLCHTT